MPAPANQHMTKITSKMLGDAGEHYALSQLTFANKPATKMPDNWEGYDLAVEAGEGLVRVSVKTRSETKGWKSSKWFTFDDRKNCEWMIFIFKQQDGNLRAWIIPYSIALANANIPGANRKSAWDREIGWNKLNNVPLLQYENNWEMNNYITDN